MSNSRLGLKAGILAAALVAAVTAHAQAVQPSLAAASGGLAPNPLMAAPGTSVTAQAPATQVPTVQAPVAGTPAGGQGPAAAGANPVAAVIAPSAAPFDSTVPGSYTQQAALQQAPAGAVPSSTVPGAGFQTAGPVAGASAQPNAYGVVPGAAGTATPPQGMAPPKELPPLPTSSSELPNVISDQLGVTPKQIRDLHRTVDERQRAASEMLNPPKTVTSSLTVSLAPGATPPVIRPFYGATTSFLIVDSTGQPWPVENAHNGNDGMFKIDRLDGPQGSTFTIDALQPYGQSNMILKLKDVPTPVVLTLIAGQKVQDVRVEVRVAGRGPNAQRPVVSGSLPPGTDARLLPVLDGVAPAGASPLTVLGMDGVKAWLLPNGHMLVRAPFKLLSPVIAATSSADGTTVYELPATPKLLGIQGGNYVNLSITGW